MPCANTVGGDKYLRVKARPEQIDSDDGCPLRFSTGAKRLAQQHLEPFEGGMGMTADCMAYDLGWDHVIDGRRVWETASLP